MKKLLSISITLLFFSNLLLSQPLQIIWQNCYGGSGSDWAYDLLEVDNGYFIAGTTNSPNGNTNYHGADDGWLVKIDSVGSLIWEKCYGGTKGDGIMRILNSQDENYFLVGVAYSSDGSISNDPYPDSHDYWVIKIDENGDILWDKLLGGNGMEQMFNATPTSDGGVIAIGYTTSFDGDISKYYGYYDTWLIKLNSDGNTDWDFTIGTALNHEVGDAVIQTRDGGYLVGSSSQPEGVGNITCTPHSWHSEANIFRLDTNGHEVWQQCYGGSGHEGITELIEVEDGYLVLACTESNDGDVSGFHGTPLESYDIWIVKTDHYGHIIWENCYGGYNDDYAEKVFQTSDGGFVVFGITYSNNGDVSGNPSLDKFRPSIWVFKIDSVGKLLWQQCFGGIAYERVHFGVVKKSDHNFVIAGEMSYGPSFDVSCFNQDPGIKPDFWVFEVVDTTTNSIVSPQVSDFKVYPNPATSILYIELPQNFDIKSTEIEIIDVCGRAIFGIKPTSLSLNIDISRFNSGMYFVRVQNDKAVTVKRIIKY